MIKQSQQIQMYSTFLLVLIVIYITFLQIVGPADGSEYVIDYYGPRLSHITKNNETIFRSL